MTRRVRLVQVGVGSVGSAAARLVLEHREHWLRRYDLEVSYAALVDSSGALTDERLSERQVRSALEAKAAGSSLLSVEGTAPASLDEVVSNSPLTSAVLIDCAAGEATYAAHLAAARRGWAVVLANKAPLAVDQDRYDELARAAGPRLWNEATVGAGLPVVSTLRALLDTGDQLEDVRGCMSGTLGYITSELMAGSSYSTAVGHAREKGYTEPDPRDDLSGLDVARKALILARTAGRKLDLSDVAVEPLLPALPASLSVQEFLEQSAVADADMERRVSAALAAGETLKYVAYVSAAGRVRVGLSSVPRDSAIGSLTGPDNIFVFSTREYAEHPLVVRGPGAGPVNTAMGMLADVIAAART